MAKRASHGVSLKKIWSWIWPVREVSIRGKLNHHLHITWENGKRVLNSDTANYSFGSLHTVFKKALAAKPLPQSGGPVLILGFGAGSIYHILRKQHPHLHMVGVDADPEVWRLANTYFLPQQDPYLEQVCAFAEDFSDKPSGPYRAIFVDVFINTATPDFFGEGYFWVNLAKLLAPEGKMYVNLMPKEGENPAALSHIRNVFNDVLLLHPTAENLVVVAQVK